MEFTPAITLHLIAAFASLIIGGIVLASTKGTYRHRMLGRVWVLVMATTAISSFWIKHSGNFSWIHLLSIWVLIALIAAIVSIYRKNVRSHLRFMRGAYVGLAIAGVFTLLPARRLGAIVWHAVGLV
ncbi:MAG: DUF2306 domain-containing protein [Burkholderiales bacterium]|nr:DUF2306 domain-containing protein [Burkholderiales bacterium]